MKNRFVYSMVLAATVLATSCNNANNQTGKGEEDSVKTIDTRRNTLGTEDKLYDTANTGGDSTPNRGGTPRNP